jgi:hypothetical protein
LLRLLDSKTRWLCPSESKAARFQAPLSSPPERNRARYAFKRFFPPKSLRKVEILISLGQKWLNPLFLLSIPHKSWPRENVFPVWDMYNLFIMSIITVILEENWGNSWIRAGREKQGQALLKAGSGHVKFDAV